MAIREEGHAANHFRDGKVIGSRFEVAVDLSGSMLEAEESILRAVNTVGTLRPEKR